MADIAASNITYTVRLEDMDATSRMGKKVIADVAFGNGVLTYPAGGIALDKAVLGGSWEIVALDVVEAGGTGYVFQWDRSAQKLLIFESDTTGDTDKALVELDGADTPAALALIVDAIVR